MPPLLIISWGGTCRMNKSKWHIRPCLISKVHQLARKHLSRYFRIWIILQKNSKKRDEANKKAHLGPILGSDSWFIPPVHLGHLFPVILWSFNPMAGISVIFLYPRFAHVVHYLKDSRNEYSVKCIIIWVQASMTMCSFVEKHSEMNGYMCPNLYLLIFSNAL